MGRGFLGGIFWGLIAVVIGAWGLSQLGGQTVVLNAPDGSVQEAPQSITSQTLPDADGSGISSGADTSPETGQASGLSQAQPENAPSADTTSTDQPQTGTASALAEVGTGSGEAPAAPAAVQPVEAGAAAQPATPTSETSVDEPGVPSGPLTPQSTGEVQAPEQGEPDGPASLPANSVTAPQPSDAAAAPGQPDGDTAPFVDFSNPTEVETPPESEAEAVAEAATPNAPVTEEAGDDTSVPAEEVVVNRLPTVTGPVESAEDSAPEADEPPDVEISEAEDAAIVDFPPGTPALFRFAREFDNPEGKPLMGIILITDARGELSNGTAALPFPVTYAIDASNFAAAGLMEKARAAGQEVAAIAPLDPAARAEDVATAFEVYLNRVNEAVVLMDEPVGSYQSSREMANAVVARADLDGHGIITYPRGLNAGVQVAEREGVPVALVFREFDNAGQDRAAMKRFLDQAAFRAGQQSGVILVGHDTPETVAALLEWRLGTRAETIALAPISAMLLGR